MPHRVCTAAAAAVTGCKTAAERRQLISLQLLVKAFVKSRVRLICQKNRATCNCNAESSALMVGVVGLSMACFAKVNAVWRHTCKVQPFAKPQEPVPPPYHLRIGVELISCCCMCRCNPLSIHDSPTFKCSRQVIMISD